MAASDASEVVALAREAGRGEKDVSVVALGGERREGKLFQTMQIQCTYENDVPTKTNKKEQRHRGTQKFSPLELKLQLT
jgi:hypothetical protein